MVFVSFSHYSHYPEFLWKEKRDQNFRRKAQGIKNKKKKEKNMPLLNPLLRFLFYTSEEAL